MITRINIKEQKLRANPIKFFISVIKWLKSLLRGKKRYEGMIRIKSAVLQASKVIDFQFHLLVISSPCQSPFTSPFTPPLQSCSLLKTSSMVFTERNLSIKKNKKSLIWIWAKFLNPIYFSSGTTSTSILPFMFYISPIHFYAVNCVKNQKQYKEKIPLKKNKGRKDYTKYIWEREREIRISFFFFFLRKF